MAFLEECCRLRAQCPASGCVRVLRVDGDSSFAILYCDDEVLFRRQRVQNFTDLIFDELAGSFVRSV